MSEKSIDVNFEDVNKKYYSIDEVSKILDIEQSTIAYYFEKLNDFLNITSVGMYQLFDNTDVKNLKKIKDLEQNSNMSMKQIRKALITNKQEILLEKVSNNKLDESVLNIFQKFANALMEQNFKIDEMNKTNIKLVETINIISQNQGSIQKELQEQKELNRELLEKYKVNSDKQSIQLNSIQKEIAITKDIDKKLDEQKNQIENNFKNAEENILKENKKEYEKLISGFKCITQEQLKLYEEQNQHQGFFSKLFIKKK